MLAFSRSLMVLTAFLIASTVTATPALPAFQRLRNEYQFVFDERVTSTLTKTVTSTHFTVLTATSTRARVLVGEPLQQTRVGNSFESEVPAARVTAVVGEPLRWTRVTSTWTIRRTVTETLGAQTNGVAAVQSLSEGQTLSEGQSLSEGQRRKGCDRAACKSRRAYYRCEAGEPEW